MANRSAPAQYDVGVDLGPAQIVAGVFNGHLRFVRKAKLSTKTERGRQAVLDRIARCVHDAVDESDLTLGQVRGIGIGAPGEVESEPGLVRSAPQLGWQDVPLRAELEARLRLPVMVDGAGNAAALGIYLREFEGKPRVLAALVLGAELYGGLIVENALSSRFDLRRLSIVGADGSRLPSREVLGEKFANTRPKDLRQAVRRGEKSAERLVCAAAHRTGLLMAQIIREFQPDVIALAGPVMEELKEEMLPPAMATALDNTPPDLGRRVSIFASELGGKAILTGAAALVWSGHPRLGDGSGCGAKLPGPTRQAGASPAGPLLAQPCAG